PTGEKNLWCVELLRQFWDDVFLELQRQKKTVVPDRFEPELSSYLEHRARHRQTLQRWEAQINSVGGLTKRILVLNRVDLEGPPKNFTYINGYKVLSEGISVALGCECTSCLENPVGGCCPGVSGHAFSDDEYGQGKVKPGEVVQKEIQHTLCIFKPDNGRGWGVRTSEHIKRHSFIIEYVAEIITTEEAERRGQVYDKQGATYLFDLDYVEDEYTVDAARYGNLSHINEYSALRKYSTNLRPSLRSFADSIRFSSRMVLYLAPSIFPSILTIFPVPAEEKQAQTMMLPPPCLTVGMVCSG
uniref:SUV39H1 histone lysine methyltransferase b n=1 Tax=Oncorhynchus tshawytscha TaxID=74940 RepID=A0A8C8M9Q3_ONCTS